MNQVWTEMFAGQGPAGAIPPARSLKRLSKNTVPTHRVGASTCFSDTSKSFQKKLSISLPK